MTKLFAIAALATILIGGDALALPAVQSNHGLRHEAQVSHLGGVHGRGRSRVSGVEVHSFSFGVQTPVDNTSGHSSGKRQHKPMFRDAASGLSTGKRMH